MIISPNVFPDSIDNDFKYQQGRTVNFSLGWEVGFLKFSNKCRLSLYSEGSKSWFSQMMKI